MDLVQEDIFAAPELGNDLFGFAAEDLDHGICHYASGVLSRAIWEGFRRADASVCVPASEMGNETMNRALAYAAAGGNILVDSGAFIRKDRPETMPWEKVISNYAQLAEASTARLTFILPDVVGDQEGSLLVLAKYGPAILEAIGDRHDALLPLQVGKYAPARFARLASELLTRRIDGVAIPSHAAAFPPADLRLLSDLPATVPHRVHFLGISRNSKGLRERVLFLKEAWQDAEVSCDACLHRAQVGEGKIVTEDRRSLLEDYWDDELECWDDTEEDWESGLALARKQFPDLDDEDLAALMTSQMGSFIEISLMHERHIAINGPKATSEAIYRFAQS